MAKVVKNIMTIQFNAIDEKGNIRTINQYYKTFCTYDAEAFLQTFYDEWLKNGEPQFEICDSTDRLLSSMERLVEYNKNLYNVKQGLLGPKAKGDIELRKATKQVETCIDVSLKEVTKSKISALQQFTAGKSKLEQDKAFNVYLHKSKELNALVKSGQLSFYTQLVFKHFYRKELIRMYKEQNRIKDDIKLYFEKTQNEKILDKTM